MSFQIIILLKENIDLLIYLSRDLEEKSLHFVFQSERKRDSVNNQHVVVRKSIEMVQLSLELNLIRQFLYDEDVLLLALEPARNRNADSCLDLVPRQHPDLYPRISHVLETLRYIFLQLVLNPRDTEELHVRLDQRNNFFDGLSSALHSLVRLLQLLRPTLVKILVDEFLSDHERPESLTRKVVALLIDEPSLDLRQKLLHYHVRALQVKDQSLGILVPDDNSHPLRLARKWEQVQNLVLLVLAGSVRDHHLRLVPVLEHHAHRLRDLDQSNLIGRARLVLLLALVVLDRSHVVADGQSSDQVSQDAVLRPLDLFLLSRVFLERGILNIKFLEAIRARAIA